MTTAGRKETAPGSRSPDAEDRPRPEQKQKKSLLRRFSTCLGPGVITGAADDDPSGIATYSVAGAQLGTSLLWTALITWPLMAAVQTMCSRIGMVTGRGLMGALRQKFPRPVLVAVAFALLLANTVNIAADLSGMADAAEMLSGVASHLWVIFFGLGIVVATIHLHYAAIERVLKWLALSLLAYVVTGFYIRPPWGQVARAMLLPSWPTGSVAWATLVAILGTTISPYLFFWQASQEVEEEKAKGRGNIRGRQGATHEELVDRAVDVVTGALSSNSVMFFIMLTTAFTLHRAGITQLETSRQVAQALEPLAGRFATLLYTLGLVGTGLLAIPVLAGSAAYAFAELFGWRQGMDQRWGGARAFYRVLTTAVVVGMLLDFINVNPVKALYWAAVINGLLAPFLLTAVLLTASDRRLMQGQPSPGISRVAVGLTTLLMFGASIAMFVKR